jgi:hypothetical protein
MKETRGYANVHHATVAASWSAAPRVDSRDEPDEVRAWRGVVLLTPAPSRPTR